MAHKETWRRDFPVLVMDADVLGAVGVIRSLGRSGYPVHACSTREDALGLLSKFSHARTICPEYHTSAFLGWLRQYVARHGIRAIVPTEGLLLALRPVWLEFCELLPFSHDAGILYAGMSKYDQHSTFVNGRAGSGHLPPTIVLDNPTDLSSAPDFEALGSPLYVKVDASYSKFGEDGWVHRSASAEAARKELERRGHRFHKALVQGHVPGKGVGAFFLMWQGQVLAEFMHIRLHEVPHTGGVSSFRASWRHSGIRQDALTKLRLMQWDGIAMMEYRWDPASDEFYFMEMNGRFWGSLHLSIYAGVDFPRLLLDTFFGKPAAAPPKYPLGLRCRMTFPFDVQYVWSRWKDRGLGLRSRLWSVLEFVLLSADPRVRSDLLFPGDRGLYWESLKRFLKDFLKVSYERSRRKTAEVSENVRHLRNF